MILHCVCCLLSLERARKDCQQAGKERHSCLGAGNRHVPVRYRETKKRCYTAYPFAVLSDDKSWIIHAAFKSNQELSLYRRHVAVRRRGYITVMMI